MLIPVLPHLPQSLDSNLGGFGPAYAMTEQNTVPARQRRNGRSSGQRKQTVSCTLGYDRVRTNRPSVAAVLAVEPSSLGSQSASLWVPQASALSGSG